MSALGLGLLSLLAAVAAVAVQAEVRWVEARVEAQEARAVAAVSALGWEWKTRDDGALALFLPEGELPTLAAKGLAYQIVHGDLESFYTSRLAPAARVRALGLGSMGGYFTWSECVAEMDALAMAFPGLASPRLSLGRTHEGRDIWAWKLSARAELDEAEPVILLLSLMHAREPEGMMSLLHLARHLLEGHGGDEEATWLLEHREIWILPVLNPDGYVHNETQRPQGGGMWRKNRRDNGDGSFGVDPNRNFLYLWGYDDSGSSPSTSADVYRGPAPMSEPETRALRDFVLAHGPSISVNTHTFGDLMVRPWGWANQLCADDAVFGELAESSTRATAYRPGNTTATLNYLANGSHDDYMWGETGDKPRVFGVTPELGNSNDGFWPAADRIDPLRVEALPQHLALVWAAGQAPRIESWSVDDPAPAGDGDGVAEPGEVFTLRLAIRNRGLLSTLGPLSVRIESRSCALVVEDGAADLGEIAAQSTVTPLADVLRLRVAAGARPGLPAALTVTLSDAGGDYPVESVVLLPGQPRVLFADDFESGPGAWRLTGFGLESAQAGRAGEALSDSPGGNYAADSDATAEMAAAFDLSGFAHAWLVFDQRFWVDNDFDAATVEVSQAGGPWLSLSGEGSDRGSGVGAQPAGAPVWDGHIFAWTTARVDLGAFAGTAQGSIRLRFRLRSDAAIGYDGWHVDNVRLLAFEPAPAPRLPNEPRSLLAARSGAQVALSWTAPVVDPGHEGADAYELHRSASIRGAGGFVRLTTAALTSASDPEPMSTAASFAYQVVATNCGGASSVPPR